MISPFFRSDNSYLGSQLIYLYADFFVSLWKARCNDDDHSSGTFTTIDHLFEGAEAQYIACPRYMPKELIPNRTARNSMQHAIMKRFVPKYVSYGYQCIAILQSIT